MCDQSPADPRIAHAAASEAGLRVLDRVLLLLIVAERLRPQRLRFSVEKTRNLIGLVETMLYIIVGGLLVLAGGLILWDTLKGFVDGIEDALLVLVPARRDGILRRTLRGGPLADQEDRDAERDHERRQEPELEQEVRQRASVLRQVLDLGGDDDHAPDRRDDPDEQERLGGDLAPRELKPPDSKNPTPQKRGQITVSSEPGEVQ